MWGKPTRFVRIFPASTRLHIGTRGHFSFSKKLQEKCRDRDLWHNPTWCFYIEMKDYLRDLTQKQRIGSIASGRAMWWWTDQSGSGKQSHPPPGEDPGLLLQAQHSQLYLICPASRNSLHKLLCHQLFLCAHHKFSVPPHFGRKSCPDSLHFVNIVFTRLESYNCVMWWTDWEGWGWMKLVYGQMGPFSVAQIDLQEHWIWFHLPSPPEKAPEASLQGSSAPPESHYFYCKLMIWAESESHLGRERFNPMFELL